MRFVVKILCRSLASGLHFGDVASQLVSNFVNRQRPAKVVALDLVTMMCSQERHLGFIFDAFGDHLKIQAFRHADDRGCDRSIIRLYSDIADKRAVDFELADAKLSQGCEVGIASSK